MSTLTLRIADAVASAKVALTAALDDKITPVLRCAIWEPEHQALTSTDRYSAVTYHLPESKYEPRHVRDRHEGDDQPDEIAIPRELLDWVAKQKVEYDRHIRYSMQSGTVTAELINSQDVVFGTSVTPRVIGNFPPIFRLIEAWKPADDATPVAFSPALLKRLLTPLATLTKKEPVRFELGTYGDARSHKTAPAMISWGPVKILVQPNILKG